MKEQRKKPLVWMLFSCNEWKEKPMPLIRASTSPFQIKKAIITCIEKGDMEYGKDPETMSKRQQVKEFRADWERLTRNEINSKLRYGFYDYTYSGELM